ncbi:MAG: diaminopimelate decarboxylase [Planctomycetota bacterium]|nr:MAG: diaminopimelate decarboxylase [Planctomycetota bacterium]
MPTPPDFPDLRDEVAGHSVAGLAQEFGTPVYVYDAATITARVADLQSFDVVRYAQKACSNIAILDRVKRAGAVVDAVSAGEIERGLHVGFDPRTSPPGIVYTADLFDEDALDLVVRHQVPVNVGSPDMIDQLGHRAPGRPIMMRINPGFGHGHSQKTNTGGPQSKHGIWHSQIDDCLHRARKYGLTVTGLHMHIGSGTDLDHLRQVCSAMETACRLVGPTVETISAGGGLPVPYRSDQSYVDLDEYFALWDATRKRLEAEFGHAVTLEIEPGRYLAAECGTLITQIRAIKRMGDNLFYLVDAGFNDLARPILYGAYHPIAVAYNPELGTPNQPISRAPVIVGGPLCESGDIFTQTEGGYVEPRALPQARVGDFLVIGVAGAYGFAMASNYNSKFRAAEVLLEGGQAKLIRRRETFADLIELERIPQ